MRWRCSCDVSKECSGLKSRRGIDRLFRMLTRTCRNANWTRSDETSNGDKVNDEVLETEMSDLFGQIDSVLVPLLQKPEPHQ